MTTPKTSKEWAIFAQISIVAFTMLGTLGLSVSDKPAAPFAVVGLGVLLLLRFGDIASLTLKGFGAEAVVQRAERAAEGADRAASEAEQVVKALKELGLHLSKSVLNLELLQGRRALSTLERSLETREVVVSDLRAMGFTTDEIERELFQSKFFAALNMIYEALNGVGTSQASGIEEEVHKMAESGKPFDIEAVKGLFVNWECLLPEIEEWLNEVDRFQRTGQVDLNIMKKIRR